MLMLLLLLLLQAPGDGWALAPVPPRAVKTLYWDLFDTSETWVSIIPTDRQGRQPLVRLVFQAYSDGKEAKGPPSRLVLRALPLPMTVIERISLRLVVDQETFDLGLPCESTRYVGPACQLLFPVGEQSSANGIAVDISPGLLERVSRAHYVTGTVLGIPIVLSSEDRAALSQFIKALHLKAGRRRTAIGADGGGRVWHDSFT
jgi:hypothetical protein